MFPKLPFLAIQQTERSSTPTNFLEETQPKPRTTNNSNKSVTDILEKEEAPKLSQSYINQYNKESIREEEFLNHSNAVYASKHYDTISVASINQKCFILTPNEYFKYMKKCTLLKHNFCQKKHINSESSIENSKNFDVVSLSISTTANADLKAEMECETEMLRSMPSCSGVDADMMDADKMTEKLRQQPIPEKFGFVSDKSLVYFCPGIYEVTGKKGEKKLKRDIDIVNRKKR